MSDKTPIQDFYDRCQYVDWYYGFSDDFRVFQRGEAALRALKAEAEADPAKLAIYEAWNTHFFTGKPWGNEQQPPPERPA